jgi:hypothetical protein
MDKPMERKGMGGMGKMGHTMPAKSDPMKKEQGKTGGEMGEGKQTTITHNEDGTHSVHHADGEQSDHPDHLHMLTHIGHKVTGGDKHHMVHHDGMQMHSHGVHESGEHDGTHSHENLDELKSSMDQFLGEEGQEGQSAGGDVAQMPEPAMGGMRG